VARRRRKIPGGVETSILVACRRRCCLCVYLSQNEEVRRGQIAHVNRNASDHRLENLVFLCFDHHDEYDGTTSQSKGITAQELVHYRDLLIARFPDPDAAEIDIEEICDRDNEYATVRRNTDDLDFLDEPWRFALWQVANEPELFAYKSTNRADGVCLIERINLPDERIVVVCIQIAGSPGQSVTNAVEELCFQVCSRFEIPSSKLVWIEHYDYYEPQTWNLVTFGTTPPNGPFRDPTWTEMTAQTWADLRLRPKRKLRTWLGQYQSKVSKLFRWPTEGILSN
jgi:hypothetical protein